jgi:hypothetical protein
VRTRIGCAGREPVRLAIPLRRLRRAPATARPCSRPPSRTRCADDLAEDTRTTSGHAGSEVPRARPDALEGRDRSPASPSIESEIRTQPGRRRRHQNRFLLCGCCCSRAACRPTTSARCVAVRSWSAVTIREATVGAVALGLQHPATSIAAIMAVRVRLVRLDRLRHRGGVVADVRDPDHLRFHPLDDVPLRERGSPCPLTDGALPAASSTLERDDRVRGRDEGCHLRDRRLRVRGRSRPANSPGSSAATSAAHERRTCLPLLTSLRSALSTMCRCAVSSSISVSGESCVSFTSAPQRVLDRLSAPGLRRRDRCPIGARSRSRPARDHPRAPPRSRSSAVQGVAGSGAGVAGAAGGALGAPVARPARAPAGVGRSLLPHTSSDASQAVRDQRAGVLELHLLAVRFLHLDPVASVPSSLSR